METRDLVDVCIEIADLILDSSNLIDRPFNVSLRKRGERKTHLIVERSHIIHRRIIILVSIPAAAAAIVNLLQLIVVSLVVLRLLLRKINKQPSEFRVRPAKRKRFRNMGAPDTGCC